MQTALSIPGRLSKRLAFQRCYHELSYSCFGEPADVLSYKINCTSASDFPPNDNIDTAVQVEMIHVPWNPADVNIVQGKYPSPYTPTCNQPNPQSRHFEGHTILGSEGLGRVTSSNSAILPEGSLVTVAKPGMGTVRSSLWASESDLLRVPGDFLKHLGSAGSTLFQLGGTALRVLMDFVSLEPGDVVLQNAGNSGVGLMTSQLASALCGASMVSLVRRGSKSQDEFQELVDYLISVGKNALVVAEEDLQDPKLLIFFQSQLRELSGCGRLPKLTLNSVGGSSAKSLLKAMEPGGTMVTYGGMSGQSVVVATPQLIFKDVHIVGYWHSRWMVQHTHPKKQHMVDTLVRAVEEHSVACPPVEVFPLHDFQTALQWQANQGAIRSKLVWDCREKADIAEPAR